jgi:HD superfamily phosphodiesterase
MDVRELKSLAERECRRETNRFGSEFFEQHLVVAVDYALALARQLGADEEIVEAAEWLHDLSAVRDFSALATHARESARQARELLSAAGWKAERVDLVARAIEQHSVPVPLADAPPEVVCVSNADVMSHLARPAYWSYYLYGVRGFNYAAGYTWMTGRVELYHQKLHPAAQAMVAPECEALEALLKQAS